MATPQVFVNKVGRVWTARLDNPPHNFLTAPMVKELEALVHAAEADPTVGAVVLTGQTPDVFISHFDVGEIADGGDQTGAEISPRAASIVLAALGLLLKLPPLRSAIENGPLGGIVNLIRMHALFARMETSPVVFIAAINGRALGGGFELALACDFRLIAAESGIVGLPELNHGIIPGAGGTQRLARVVGTGRALEMILQSRFLDAATAERWGVVHAAVPADELLDAAVELATASARRTRVSVAAAKAAVRAAYTLGGDAAEARGFVAAASTPAANAALKLYHQRIRTIEPMAGNLEAELEQWRSGAVMGLND